MKKKKFYICFLGSCGFFSINSKCHASSTLNIISKHCLFKKSCEISISNQLFGIDPCFGSFKHLSVQATCSKEKGLIYLNVNIIYNNISDSFQIKN